MTIRNLTAAHPGVLAVFGLTLCLVGVVPVLAQDPPPPTDEDIRTQIERVFESTERWSSIDVSVTGGVVTLEGSVVRQEHAESAAAIARSIDGVVFVDDQLEAARDLGRTLESAGARLYERFHDLVGLTPLLLLGALALGFFLLLARFVAQRIHASRTLFRNRFIRDIARQAAWLGIVVLGVLFVLDLLDATAAVGAVLGTAGIAGLALGFAFRDLVENYVASVLLSLRHPFTPNDHVVVDGQEGRVVRLTSRATILLTLEGNHLRIPNAKVFKANILNYTRNSSRRFDFEVGIGTEEDLQQALAVGADALRALEGTLDEPDPFALAETLGDSTVQLRFHAWVDQTSYDFMKVRSAAITAVKNALDDAGIEMPEPIYRVRTFEVSQSQSPRADGSQRSVIAFDVTVEDDLERQIHREREDADEDLLQADAPLE